MLNKIIFFLIYLLWSSYPIHASLEQAQTYYEQGEKASTLLERQKAFNQALSLYLDLEKTLSHPSASFYAAVGDCFFRLDTYAWAVFYYERALLLDPQNLAICEALDLARIQLGLPPTIPRSSLQQIFTFDPFLPFTKRLIFFYWLIGITVLFYSLCIYYPSSMTKFIARTSLILSFLLFLNLFISFYLVPLKAVLIASTGLYRSPDSSVQITTTPLFEGSRLSILDEFEQGKWLKVQTPDGMMGYIPASCARILEESTQENALNGNH